MFDTKFYGICYVFADPEGVQIGCVSAHKAHTIPCMLHEDYEADYLALLRPYPLIIIAQCSANQCHKPPMCASFETGYNTISYNILPFRQILIFNNIRRQFDIFSNMRSLAKRRQTAILK